MLQKVAAMVDKVAADLCFSGSKVRWMLRKNFFGNAASSAASLWSSNSSYSPKGLEKSK